MKICIDDVFVSRFLKMLQKFVNKMGEKNVNRYTNEYNIYLNKKLISIYSILFLLSLKKITNNFIYILILL